MILTQPLDQFEIFTLSSINKFKGLNILGFYNNFLFDNCIISLNLSIYLGFLFIALLVIFNSFFLNKVELLESGLLRYLGEIFFYSFVCGVFLAQVGKDRKEYFPYLFTLFFFILLSNFIGLVPFSFTITSHILLTFLLGGFTIIGLTILGFMNLKLEFLQLFVPTGVPKLLLPLLVVIEVISYIARGFSLSIRLFANLMSGHALIHILLFFIVKIINFNFKLGLISVGLISIIFFLEIGISFLQAYVFIVLISIYFKDAYEVSH